MKKMLLFLALFAFLLPVIVEGGADTSVSISAPSLVVTGNEFYVSVMAQNLKNFDAADYSIYYDPSILQIEEVYNGSINGTEIPVNYSIDASNGICKIVQYMGLNGINGSGYLSKIRFLCIGEGTFCLNIEGNLSDVKGDEISAYWIGRNVTATSTILKVEAPDIVSSEFYVNIGIYNVRNFSAINFDFSYDAYFLEFKEIENGSINGTEVNVKFNQVDNSIRIVGMANASGNGYIAKIKFTPKNAGVTTLNITNITISSIIPNLIFAYIENKSISIGVNPPVANFSYIPLNPTTQDVIQFIDNSSDMDGFITNYTWNFGDGNYSYEKNPSHQYADDGTYEVTLTIRDNDGATTSIEKEIDVSPKNHPPNRPSQPYPNNGEIDVSLNPILKVNVSDPDGDIMNVYFYDTDGNSLIGIDENVESNHTASIVWQNLEYGKTYSWYVIVNDTQLENNSQIWHFTTMDMPLNHPPNTPSISGPSSGYAGVPYKFSTSAIDPDGDDIYYLFDWGDGSNSGWLGPYDSGKKVSEYHTWNNVGKYYVKVKAKDENKESGWSDIRLSLIHI